jgi:indolepyruvate ferredoxin oxidoreductase beta subunit
MNVMNPPVVEETIIKLAVLAIGGQGGGVLSDWVVAVAESEGWYAQSTSVPGVAQRTGATIYYIEMVPDRGDTPILSLMPTPGDVDVVVAAEWMEAGRAIQRGLVTPDRTVLIASTHRSLAVGEKIVPGNGIGDPAVVERAATATARRLICGDMERQAREAGSVISASLLGALAASGALPFRRESYEAIIRSGDRGAAASLRAFEAGWAGVMSPASAETPAPAPAEPGIAGPPALIKAWDELVARLQRELPAESHAMARAGLAKVVDYQDLAYGAEYLDLLARVAAVDRQAAVDGSALTVAAAKHVANAMAYDDVIRVADLKTRPARFRRIRDEVGQRPDQVLHVTEYMHPRGEEVCGLMPAAVGRWFHAKPRRLERLDAIVSRGRRVRTDGILWFTALHVVGGLRRLRRGTYRHALEVAHRERWLAEALRLAPLNYPLAVEVLNTRRLIKGYSDTHARGLSKFDRVMGAIPRLTARADGGDWLRRLREAALKDEEGTMLEGALRTVETL